MGAMAWDLRTVIWCVAEVCLACPRALQNLES